MAPKIIELHANSWTSILDFYRELLKKIGAPEWHGESIDALIDSMIYGGINEVEPPYLVRVLGTQNIDRVILRDLEIIGNSLSEARMECLSNTGNDRDVALKID